MNHSAPPVGAAAAAPTIAESATKAGRTVLVLQGGGALGAYQAGVYEAMHEAGIEPDWVIGTSIGAINAGLIAGNAPENRLDRLRTFWDRMRHPATTRLAATLPGWGSLAADALTAATGVAGFFRPNPWALWSGLLPMAPEATGYYSVGELEATLAELIDERQLSDSCMRMTVGAANVQTAAMTYFDSREKPLTLKHILASGALPPAFPAVRIDGELYWDGGILSNTPVEAVFDDNPRRSSLVFAVHVWNPAGPEPDSIQRVLARQKDLQYASRAGTHIARQRQLHRLRHVISELVAAMPAALRDQPEVRELAAYGCQTRMHVVRLLAPVLASDDHAKDIDFSPEGITDRWRAGLEDTRRVLAARPWEAPVDPLEGFVLHEATGGEMRDPR